jgi:hypothetical protein
VYKHVLVYDEPFEFWPETSYKKSSARVRRPNQKELRNSLRTRELNLALLRTSKLVYEEAAEIFYGLNEFRFSGCHGHVVAAAFAYTIGPRHLQWLTNLTIGMPFRARPRSVQIFNKEAAHVQRTTGSDTLPLPRQGLLSQRPVVRQRSRPHPTYPDSSSWRSSAPDLDVRVAERSGLR